MQPDAQQNDHRWQWEDSQWSDSTEPPRDPLDVPDPDDPDPRATSKLRRLMRWAAR